MLPYMMGNNRLLQIGTSGQVPAGAGIVAGANDTGNGLTGGGSTAAAASTAPTTQATGNLTPIDQLTGTSVTTSGIQGPDPSLYNTFSNPWQSALYQGYQQQNANAGTITDASGNRVAPGAQAFLDSGTLDQSRAGQTSLANTLATQAAGGGMSAADIQQQQGITNSVQAAQAAAATAGNSANPFLLQRQLMQNQAATNQAGVGQAALLRAQETQAAQQALGGVLQNQAGNALTQATNTAQINQGYAQAGLSGQLAAANGLAGNNQALLGANTTTANSNAALTDSEIKGETTGGDSVGTGFGKAVGGLVSGIAGALGL